MGLIQEVLLDSPLAAYALDEPLGAATAKDYSGNGRHATYVGSPTLGSSGYLGMGPSMLSSTGSAQYAETPTFAGLGTTQAQSHEWLIYLPNAYTAASTGKTMIGSDNGNVALFGVGEATGLLTGENAVVINDDGGANQRTGWTTPATHATGWHHYVLTFSGTQHGWILYIDNVSYSPDLSSASGSKGIGTGRKLRYGAHSSGADAWKIQYAAVYASTLSAGRITAHYQAVLRSGVVL